MLRFENPGRAIRVSSVLVSARSTPVDADRRRVVRQFVHRGRQRIAGLGQNGGQRLDVRSKRGDPSGCALASNNRPKTGKTSGKFVGAVTSWPAQRASSRGLTRRVAIKGGFGRASVKHRRLHPSAPAMFQQQFPGRFLRRLCSISSDSLAECPIRWPDQPAFALPNHPPLRRGLAGCNASAGHATQPPEFNLPHYQRFLRCKYH